MKVSLCMIVKDEEECLSRCLMSIKDLVDEMIVIDTGSTDRTKFIAEVLGAKVYDFEWTNSFSDARNFSISKASGDWIVVLDADEELDFTSKFAFKEYLKQVKEGKQILVNPVSFRFRNYHDMGFVTTEHYHARMFPNDGNFCYEGTMHEQVKRKDGKHTTHVKAGQIMINHYGYTGEKNLEKGKIERNIKLLQEQIKEKPEYPFHYYNLMNCYVVDNNFKEAIKTFKDLKKCEKNCYSPNGNPASFLPDAYKLASISYFEGKNFERALQLSLEGLDMLPDAPGLCYSCGIALFALGQFQLAYDYATKAINNKTFANIETLHDPSASSWKANKLRGLCLANLQRFQEAKKELEKAIQSHPMPDPDLINGYQMVCNQLGVKGIL